MQTIALNGEVYNEGALKVPYFCDPVMSPFALPYSAMVPKQGEVDNLLVPVALSASHVAFNAIRMEPTWMILGQVRVSEQDYFRRLIGDPITHFSFFYIEFNGVFSFFTFSVVHLVADGDSMLPFFMCLFSPCS